MKSLEKLILISVILFSLTDCRAQDHEGIKVLFVGNSLTFFNNMPEMVASAAATQGVKIHTRQSTVSGSSLEEHWNEEKGTQTRKLLEEEKWDYVVFNNYSRSPIDNKESFETFGKEFIKLVRSKGATPILYMTWAYKSNPFMQPEISEGYLNLGAETNVDVVPAGLIFEKARIARPDLNFYTDDKHPSPHGSYLVAMAFYKYFTGNSTAAIPHRLKTIDQFGNDIYLILIKPEDADFLQQVVDDFEFKTIK